MSKILLYQEAATGVTTNAGQTAFFINENGVPTVKSGSQVITFSTSGSAFTGSSGSSGATGSAGVNGTAGTSGQNGNDGLTGSSGTSGARGSSGSSGANGIDGANGIAGTSGLSGTNGTSNGTSGVSGTNGTSNGTSGVSGAAGSSGSSGATGSSGAAGSSGSSGASGLNGTSGTSSAGGGGGDTLYTQEVSISTSQPTITGSAKQWRSLYGDGNALDQGSGGAFNDVEFGFLIPFFLAPGETIEKVGFYFMDYTASGTAAFKLVICDKHPDAYLPWNLLHSETLTFTHDDADNKFISWDYDFTNTGTTVNSYFAYILFANEASRTFELCRTVQTPYLMNDYRLIHASNRYDANSHWVTAYHSIYSSLPSTMSSVLASNLYYNNQRGGHMYYQTSRP